MSRKRLQAVRLLLAVNVMCLLCGAGWGDRDRIWEFDIPRQNVSAALTVLAQQTGTQLLFPYDQVNSQEANPLAGRYTLDDALEIMLRGTGLAGGVTGSGVITISLETWAKSQDQGDDMGREKKKGILAGVAGAVLSAFGAQNAAGQQAGEVPSTRGTSVLEEIIVTAQKRSERLQDVPVPVTAISGQQLIEGNLVRLQDYYTRVPGLNMVVSGFSREPQLAIRGLTTGGFENPVVGIVVDDVPFGSSLGVTLGNLAPDFDPSDLERIEVLRGPQGTLYGASSMGGLLKYVTVDPSTDAFTARGQVGLSSISEGDDFGYNVRGAVNIPLSDTLAMRATAFSRRDPGYIDNPVQGTEDVNEVNVAGGRLSALWQPASDAFSLKLSALYQSSDGDASSEVTSGTGLGNLQQDKPPGTGWYDREQVVLSAILTAKAGAVDLTSVSGYNVNELSEAVVPFGPTLVLYNNFKTNKFSQEFRGVLPIGSSLEWLVGAFYTSEETDPRQQDLYGIDPTTGEVGANILMNFNPSEFEELAAFSTLTWQVSDRFDLQIGARASWNEVFDHAENTTGAGVEITEGESSDNAVTYLFTPRFTVSEDLMVYARFASGYRAGGPNPNFGLSGGPPEFGSDTTESYEIGTKGSLFGERLGFDLSVYYVDWTDIQLRGVQPGNPFSYVINAGRAKSEGIELTLETKPWTGGTISAWGAFNAAELTEDLPPESTVVASSGDRLPNSARRSGNLSLDQSFRITDAMTGYFGASVTYIGDRPGTFVAGAAVRPVFPSYTQTDLRMGVRHGAWEVNAFANNVTDERGLLSGNPAISPNYSYIQPRTVGVNLSRFW